MAIYSLRSRRLAVVCSSIAILSLLYHIYRHLSFTPVISSASLPSQEHGTPQRPSLQKHNLLDDISNATLGFQKIFMINLPSRTDRRDTASLAAAFTGIQIEYINGVTAVNDKAWPPGAEEVGMKSGSAGTWRSHMNAIRTIVEQNLTSALVIEDDADWDIRIKEQMRDFAKASRLLVQPLPGTTDQFLDPTWHRSDAQHEKMMDFDISQVSTGEPTTSPYGDIDRWDMLWIGHCGCRFPRPDDENIPLARAVIPNDTTVPPRSTINIEFGDTQLLKQYPDHTRVVARSRMNTCALGYALSQAGARQLLYQIGVEKIDGTVDMMMRSVCDGSSGRQMMICLSPQPALFNHHRPVGPRSSFSNIAEDYSGWNNVALSENIRWAARVNLPKLTKGQTDYIDWYEDGD